MAALSDNMTLLEPSAGMGKIIDTIDRCYSFTGMQYHMVELNKEKCRYLSLGAMTNPSRTIYHADFLEFKTDIKFDRIIACPPFKGNTDVLHIEKMYSHLKKKGLLVTLTSPYWLTNNEPIQVKFREWLSDKEYSLHMLPDNTFMEKDRTVPTAMLRIYKR